MRSTAVAVAVAVACFLTCLEAQDPLYNQLLPYDTTFASPGGNGSEFGAGLIQIHDGGFVDSNCKPFVFVGDLQGNDIINYLFKIADQANFRVIRTEIGGANPPTGQATGYSLQAINGTAFNEAAFVDLDRFIATAEKYNVKLILALIDNWNSADGVKSLVAAAGGSTQLDFFTMPEAKQLYMDRVKTIITRVNTITKQPYFNSTAIMAWDLINEIRDGCNVGLPSYQSNPLCAVQNTASVQPLSLPVLWPLAADPFGQCLLDASLTLHTYALQSWIEQMSAYVHQLDPNHLVTVGEEGFWGPGGNVAANPPGSTFGEYSGQDFKNNMAGDAIDFAEAHLWPDNWQINQSYGQDPVAFSTSWINAHLADSTSLGKPFVLEEFGKQTISANTTQTTLYRNPVFAAVFNSFASSLQSNGPFKGVLFWQFPFIQGQDDENSVLPSSTTWNNIVLPAAGNAITYMQKASPVPGCTKGSTKAIFSGLSPAGAAPGPPGVQASGRRLME
eukprot:jgi/Astpho2/1911/Aster-x1048